MTVEQMIEKLQELKALGFGNRVVIVPIYGEVNDGSSMTDPASIGGLTVVRVGDRHYRPPINSRDQPELERISAVIIR